MFSITAKRRSGKITIGDFVERFALQPGYWTPAQYRENWRRSLTHLVRGGRRAALMTWMSDPRIGGHFRAWILYRSGGFAYIQERLFVFGRHAPRFTKDQRLIDKSKRVKGISEWKVSLADIFRFLDLPPN